MKKVPAGLIPFSLTQLSLSLSDISFHFGISRTSPSDLASQLLNSSVGLWSPHRLRSSSSVAWIQAASNVKHRTPLPALFKLSYWLTVCYKSPPTSVSWILLVLLFVDKFWVLIFSWILIDIKQGYGGAREEWKMRAIGVVDEVCRFAELFLLYTYKNFTMWTFNIWHSMFYTVGYSIVLCKCC